jgi:C1A family cysteine protease
MRLLSALLFASVLFVCGTAEGPLQGQPPDKAPDKVPPKVPDKLPPGKTHGRGRIAPPPHVLAQMRANQAARHVGRPPLPKATAATYDCRALGLVPPIVDQGQCGSCLPKGSLVRMADGSERPIETVQAGDYVLTAEGRRTLVVATTAQHVTDKLWTIMVDDQRLRATGDHAILTQRGYVPLREVLATDLVATFPERASLPDVKDTFKRGQVLQRPAFRPIRSIVEGSLFDGYVYDLQTLGDHSFVANGIGVHNCWDFSGTCVCECALIKAGVLKNDGTGALSEQYTLDCGKNGGCNGDDNTTVTIWAKATGLPLTSAYGPYKGSAGSCQYTSSMKLYQISDWGFADGGQGSGVTPTQQIKDAILAYGPVGCAVAAGGSAFWDSGTGTDTGTSTSIDHDVVLVGWDDTHDNGDGSKGAWIMRNSWSTTWGSNCANTVNPTPVEAGYGWVKYGSDSIGTETIWAVATGPTPSPPAAAPVITSPLAASGVVGTPFAYQIAASNTPTAFAASGLPAGLSISTTGFVSGTPGAAGTSAVTLSAANASGAGTATLALTITGVPPPPPPPPPGPVAPVTITLSADLPAGQYQLVPSGSVVIWRGMPLGDYLDALERCRLVTPKSTAPVPARGGDGASERPLPWPPVPPESPCDRNAAEIERLKAEIAEQKRAISALLDSNKQLREEVLGKGK